MNFSFINRWVLYRVFTLIVCKGTKINRNSQVFIGIFTRKCHTMAKKDHVFRLFRLMISNQTLYRTLENRSHGILIFLDHLRQLVGEMMGYATHKG